MSALNLIFHLYNFWLSKGIFKDPNRPRQYNRTIAFDISEFIFYYFKTVYPTEGYHIG